MHHFWRMIAHETSSTAVVVMLTQTWEAGRDKCYQYFPLNVEDDPMIINEADEFGDGFRAEVRLLELSTDTTSCSTVRKISLKTKEKKKEEGEEIEREIETEKIVWHLLFEGWPDFTVPEGENRTALLHLIKLSAAKNEHPDNPRIIHCSAGVGRSGTFITLDWLLGELEQGQLWDEFAKEGEEEKDPIFDAVNELRTQRMTMVQSDSQYWFIYQVLKEQWLLKYNERLVKAFAGEVNKEVASKDEAAASTA
jgi:protein-tyrosine phosphatase